MAMKRVGRAGAKKGLRRLCMRGCAVLVLLSTPAIGSWHQIVGMEALTELFSNSTIEYTWAGRTALAKYCEDGTSTSIRNGNTSTGRWWADTDKRVCFQADTDKLAICYTFYRHDQESEQYLARVVPTEGEVRFTRLSKHKPDTCSD